MRVKMFKAADFGSRAMVWYIRVKYSFTSVMFSFSLLWLHCTLKSANAQGAS